MGLTFECLNCKYPDPWPSPIRCIGFIEYMNKCMHYKDMCSSSSWGQKSKASWLKHTLNNKYITICQKILWIKWSTVIKNRNVINDLFCVIKQSINRCLKRQTAYAARYWNWMFSLNNPVLTCLLLLVVKCYWSYRTKTFTRMNNFKAPFLCYSKRRIYNNLRHSHTSVFFDD